MQCGFVRLVEGIIPLALLVALLAGCATRIASTLTVDEAFTRIGRGENSAAKTPASTQLSDPPISPTLPAPARAAYVDIGKAPVPLWPYSLWNGGIQNGMAAWVIRRDTSGCHVSAGSLRVWGSDHGLCIESSQEEVTKWAIATLSATTSRR
jgi:hypothetical protein